MGVESEPIDAVDADLENAAPRAGGPKSVNAVWTYERPYAAVAEIQGHLAFYGDRVDSMKIAAVS
jgi:uncharacterized protein (DUF427 family)